MPERRYELDEFVSFTVGADLIGTSLPIGPKKYGDRWMVKLISIQTTGNERTDSEFFAYRGQPLRVNQVDYTRKVSGDTSNTEVPIANNQTMTFVLLSATPGAICSVHITGDLYGLR